MQDASSTGGARQQHDPLQTAPRSLGGGVVGVAGGAGDELEWGALMPDGAILARFAPLPGAWTLAGSPR